MLMRRDVPFCGTVGRTCGEGGIAGSNVTALKGADGVPSAATAVLVEDPETDLPVCVSLVCSELEETRSLAVVLRQAATAVRVEDPEIFLRSCVSLVCGELEETCSLAVVF
jgi:hypothetical protein